MRPITVCPSTLALGFSTYCPLAKRLLFDGKAVSHIFPEMSPKDLDADRLQDTVQHIGRISLSGVQPKFSAIVGEDLRRTRAFHPEAPAVQLPYYQPGVLRRQ